MCMHQAGPIANPAWPQGTAGPSLVWAPSLGGWGRLLRLFTRAAPTGGEERVVLLPAAALQDDLHLVGRQHPLQLLPTQQARLRGTRAGPPRYVQWRTL